MSINSKNNFPNTSKLEQDGAYYENLEVEWRVEIYVQLENPPHA